MEFKFSLLNLTIFLAVSWKCGLEFKTDILAGEMDFGII